MTFFCFSVSASFQRTPAPREESRRGTRGGTRAGKLSRGHSPSAGPRARWLGETATGGGGVRPRGGLKQARAAAAAGAEGVASLGVPAGGRAARHKGASASPELLAPGRTDAAAQTELLFECTSTQTSSCGMCEGIFPEVESDCKQACGRCDQTDELHCLVANLQEEVGRLRNI